MPNEEMAIILLDMIDDELSIPMKRQGFLDIYNGIDVLQTRDCIKITYKTFINKICNMSKSFSSTSSLGALSSTCLTSLTSSTRLIADKAI
jgi:hypothetical protein